MRTRQLAAIVVALLAAGCGSTPRESFYMLEAPPAPPPASLTSNLTVYVGPVVVPEAVDRTPMVIRTSPNQVDVEDFHRWAEPLKTAIPRVLAEDLMRELGTARVAASRTASLLPADYRVAIEVQRFESSLADGATIDALWTVTPKSGSPRTGRTLAHEAVDQPSHAAVAAAHSRALAAIAKDIAAAIRQ